MIEQPCLRKTWEEFEASTERALHPKIVASTPLLSRRSSGRALIPYPAALSMISLILFLSPLISSPKIMATGSKLADESAGQDHPWHIYFGGEGFDQIFSIVCGFPDKVHPGLDRVVPATYFGIRVLQEALHQCELSLKIFGSLLDAVHEDNFVDDGIADFLYDIVYARESHGFSLVREEDLTNSSWGYSSCAKRGGYSRPGRERDGGECEREKGGSHLRHL